VCIVPSFFKPHRFGNWFCFRWERKVNHLTPLGSMAELLPNPKYHLTGLLYAITRELQTFFTFAWWGNGVQAGTTVQVWHELAYCTCTGWMWEWTIPWNENWQGKQKYSEKTCPSANLSIINPTWPDPGSNPGRRGRKWLTAWAMARFKFRALLSVSCVKEIVETSFS
jgi:hypothetical protein